MAKAFVTQIPHKRGPNGGLVPSMNVNPALEHGEVVVMLPPQASLYATGDLVKQLSSYLNDYNYQDGDALVAIGDPNIVAVASAILGKKYGRFALLKWDRMLGRYLRAEISI